ncbi:MAG: PIN domain-containing protein [Gemmatimonadetes bacterium]|nr:PIN domain-containing protein [Gemmatimonadota bacterium]
MDRVFLDANILFSAAYRADAGLLRLWRLPDTQLVTSRYALEEARLNLERPDQRDRLVKSTTTLEIVEHLAYAPLPQDVALPEKDRPILGAAIEAACSHLLTGDVTHFGSLYGRTVGGVRILLPSTFLRARSG